MFMRRGLTRVLKPLTVFVVGGFAYGLIEVLSRGFTHISMGVLGGAAMCLIHRLNSGARSPLRFAAGAFMSAAFITVMEFITGELLNVRLGMKIWDYSTLPLNLDGQICAWFSLLWLGLSAVGTVLDDILRAAVFKEESKRLVRTSRKLIAFEAEMADDN